MSPMKQMMAGNNAEQEDKGGTQVSLLSLLQVPADAKDAKKILSKGKRLFQSPTMVYSISSTRYK